MVAEEVVRCLEAKGYKSERHGQHWRVQCPGHNGEDLNLDVSDGQKAVMVQCFSHGCAVGTICQGAGLDPADLFFEPLPSKTPAVVEAVYPYRDEERKVLYDIKRTRDAFGKKAFLAYLPGAEKAGGVRGHVRYVLFGLPELLLVPPDGLIGIAEGEKCALEVAKLGLPCTTNAFGAGQWRQEYTDWLRDHLPDRRFLVLPDNDEPGKRHALEVCESLKHAGLKVFLADLGTLPDKGDVVQWLHGGGTVAQLREMAVPQVHRLTAMVLTARHFQALKAVLPAVLVPNALYRGCSTIFAGDAKLGKSSLLLRLALAAAVGGWWLDRTHQEDNRLFPSRILYINYEDPIELTRWRAERMLGDEPVPDNFLTMPPPYGVGLDELMDWLPEAVATFAPDAVLIDPLANAAGWTDEKNNSEVGRTGALAQQRAAELKLAILYAHHTTKAPGWNGSNIRGGGALKAAVMGYMVLEEQDNAFLLAGVHKAAPGGPFRWLIDRSADTYDWWVTQELRGSQMNLARADKAAKKQAIVDFLVLRPESTTEEIVNYTELPVQTCRDYLKELLNREGRVTVRKEVLLGNSVRLHWSAV